MPPEIPIVLLTAVASVLAAMASRLANFAAEQRTAAIIPSRYFAMLKEIGASSRTSSSS